MVRLLDGDRHARGGGLVAALTAEDEQLAQAALEAFKAIVTAVSRFSWWIMRSDLTDPNKVELAEALENFGLSRVPLEVAEAFVSIARIVSGQADFIEEALEDFADYAKADAHAGVAEARARLLGVEPPI